MTFNDFKLAMQRSFAFLLVQGRDTLYMTDVNRDLLWDTYLNSFPEAERQEHNCNCCKSFIRHYGGLVILVDNKIKTIWEFGSGGSFDVVTQALHQQVSRATIANVFFTKEAQLGTDNNTARADDGTVIRWQHMHFSLPKSMVVRGVESIDTLMGKARDNRNVFKRGLEEIKLDAVDTVLELIAQNSLYRGADYKGILESFRKLKVAYERQTIPDRENFCWAEASAQEGPVAQIKNTAIGTVLIDISTGTDLDEAVRKFEAIMAPANYKRPTAIITQKMIEQAEVTITELGYSKSLGRRFATVDDLTVNNLLFVNRDTKKAMGVLGDLKETVSINPRSLSRVDEVAVEDFLLNVLPKSTSLEVLFENRHINNLMSLIAPRDPQAPTMFKWPNNFSWSYKNAVTDSIKEKVKSAGGRTDGELRVSLEWYNFDDLDLHVVEPNGNKIYFSHKVSITGGELDVDMNAGGGRTREPVENIIWANPQKMAEGRYQVIVNQYAKRETVDVGFSVEIECQGQVLVFGYDKTTPTGHNVAVAEFTYDRHSGLTLLKSIEHNAKVNSKHVWGVDTCRFHSASMVLRSPNFWDGHKVGNAHLFFILDQAHNDEVARGFFNEFLKPELEIHKRVFEALGSRLKVDPADKQVTGLGFSVTQHTDLVIKVDGHFTRTLKIKF